MEKKGISKGVVEAAILASRGFDQSQIARTLGISQGTVSRRLRQAREAGLILYPPPMLRKDKIDSEVLLKAKSSIENIELGNELSRRLNQLADLDIIETISIVRTAGNRGREDEPLSRLSVVCQSAVSDVADMLSQAAAVGVAWGHTLRFLVDMLAENIAFDERKFSNVSIFPTVGSFPCSEAPYPLSLTSTRIAADLANLVHGYIPENQVSLASVPAFVPADLDHKPLMAFFSKLPGFREIFGEAGHRDITQRSSAFLNAADMFITGLGDMPASQGGSPALRERLRHEHASLESWHALSPGDIGGVFLPRNGIEEHQYRQVAEINERFIGVRLEDFQACARRCYRRGTSPGVVVIAHGSSKAAVALEAVRNHCVNHLFIDDDLAEELRRLLRSEGRRCR